MNFEQQPTAKNDQPPVSKLIGNWGYRISDLLTFDIGHPSHWTYYDEEGSSLDCFGERQQEDHDVGLCDKVELYRVSFENDMKVEGINDYIRLHALENGLRSLGKLRHLFVQHCLDFQERLFESASLDGRIRRHQEIGELASWMELIGDRTSVDDVMKVMTPKTAELSRDGIARLIPNATVSDLGCVRPRIIVKENGLLIDGQFEPFSGHKKTKEKLCSFFRELTSTGLVVSGTKHGLRTRNFSSQNEPIRSLCEEATTGKGRRLKSKWLR